MEDSKKFVKRERALNSLQSQKLCRAVQIKQGNLPGECDGSGPFDLGSCPNCKKRTICLWDEIITANDYLNSVPCGITSHRKTYRRHPAMICDVASHPPFNRSVQNENGCFVVKLWETRRMSLRFERTWKQQLGKRIQMPSTNEMSSPPWDIRLYEVFGDNLSYGGCSVLIGPEHRLALDLHSRIMPFAMMGLD